jgi:IS5 family transposase
MAKTREREQAAGSRQLQGQAPEAAKQARGAKKRLKTIANKQLREIDWKMTGEQEERYREKNGTLRARRELAKNRERQDLQLAQALYQMHGEKQATQAVQIWKQGRADNRRCVNGKKIILLIKGFTGNLFDGHSIKPLLNQMKSNDIPLPVELVYDRGGRGQAEVEGVTIIIPSTPKKRDNAYQKQVKRKKCRRRAAIEPIIGHLKTAFRMPQNYHLGEAGIQINKKYLPMTCKNQILNVTLQA